MYALVMQSLLLICKEKIYRRFFLLLGYIHALFSSIALSFFSFSGGLLFCINKWAM